MARRADLSPALVLYDPDCGMCTRLAEIGRRRQRPGALEWVPNDSEQAQELLRRHGLLGREQDTLVVVEGESATQESAAVVRTALRLRWPWKGAAAVWLVPRPLRDAVYRRISERRKHSCRLHPARA
jgi:predicted DCC family thiol-disulfide oxidoreductase YuxK